MEPQTAIVGGAICRLWQTPARPYPAAIPEFGTRWWFELVAELHDGRRLQINEYDWTPFDGDEQSLIPAQLTQREFSLADVEGQRIIAVQNNAGEFAVVLANGLGLTCPGGPGGNQVWIYRPQASEERPSNRD